MSASTRVFVAVGVLAALGFFQPAPSFAAFHLMQIEQVMGAVNGDKNAQAIQLRMRSSGQNIVSLGRIRAWNAAGLNPVLIQDLPTDVSNGASGARVLICSSGFTSHTSPSTVCDFTMTNLIPASYLAAGSLTFEANGGFIYWRLSWGGATYTGPGNGDSGNDNDGNYNPPFASALPTDCTRALLFQGGATAASTTNAADYAITAGAATFRNNAGTAFTISACAVNGDCNDSIACTNDSCVSSCCVFAPDNGACAENSSFCDGEEICSAVLGCVSAGNPCTTPPNLFCDETADICGACGSDGDCEDGVACTDDDCNSGACIFTPNNANCTQNGLFCDGPEICHAVSNCISSGDPCGPGAECNEATDTCDMAVIGIGLEVVGDSTAVAGGPPPPLVSPLQVTHAGDERLFVVDQVGDIRIIDNDVLLPDPFLDLTSQLTALNGSSDERGLLGLAFHPDYLSNGKFYVRYSAPRSSVPGEPCHPTCHSEVLSEYSVLGDPATSNVADDTSEVILHSVAKPQRNHNAGHVAFGPGGYLFWSMGDGGGANDGLSDVPPSHGPNGNGQNINTAMGKMLRIDVDTGSPYGIPADNPFVGVAGLDEIYAYGFRNPYRFSFDALNGDLYVGDVGQNLFEEVDLVELGGNYGWVIREGFHCFDPNNPNTPPGSCPSTGAMGEPLLDPISEYSHAVGGQAVVGGYVYRGVDFPALEGMYVYGDYLDGPTGRLYYFPTTGPSAYDRIEFHIGGGGPLDKVLKGFGEDENGELYVCASDNVGPSGGTGIIYRIVPLPSAPEAEAGGVNKNRTLSLSTPAAVAGPPEFTALKVTMVDLQHPVPANAPASVTTDYSTFDTRLNGKCVGGSHSGHHCDSSADCRVCVSGPGATLHRVCTSDANCGGGASSCPAGGTCSTFAGCTNPDEENDCARWVGEPKTYLESQTIPGLGTLRAARLQCSPFYHDWGSEGLVHVVGGEVIPSSVYEVESYSSDCIGVEDTCTLVSQPLTARTGRYGDVVATFNPPGTTQQPDGSDVVQLVNKFRNQPGAPGKAISLLQPNLPELNADVSGSDIVQCVDAVRQIQYRFGGPCPCPSLAVCNTLACPSSDTVCKNSALPGLGAQATCVRTCTGGVNDGDPCVNDSHCPSGTCGNPFCRDRCGRCAP